MSLPPDIRSITPEYTDRAAKAVEQLNLFKNRFDPALASFLKQEIDFTKSIRLELGQFMEVGAEFILRGGKRLRPAFLYYGYKAFGGTDEEGIIKASISVELVHAGALVHDDIMDNSDLRRGRPTVHTIFGDQFASSEIGRSVGIIAGDTILALSGKALSSISVPSERLAIARKFLDQMCGEINTGQYLDVLGNLLPEVDEDWIMKVLEYKTARYTVEKPILIGAVLAGADLPSLSKLSEFGISVGMAFQIQDDILGMYGDEKKVGKPVDSDLKEGKKTLLVLRTAEVLKENGRLEDLERFKSILGNHDLRLEDYLWVQETMKETGAFLYCQELARTLIREGKGKLEEVGIGSEAKEYLLGIADYMLTREV